MIEKFKDFFMQAPTAYATGQIWHKLATFTADDIPGLEAIREKLPQLLAGKPLQGKMQPPSIPDLASATKGGSQDILRADLKQAHRPADALVKVAKVNDATVMKPAPLPEASSPALAAGLREKAARIAEPVARLLKPGHPAEIAAVTGERAAQAVSAASPNPARVYGSIWQGLPKWTMLAASVLGGVASFAFLIWGLSAAFSKTDLRQVFLGPPASLPLLVWKVLAHQRNREWKLCYGVLPCFVLR